MCIIRQPISSPAVLFLYILSQCLWIVNIFAFKIIKGKPSKLEYGVPLIVEPITMHDVGHIVNDAFRDYLCRELPGNKRKLFNSLVSIYMKWIYTYIIYW